MCIQLQVVGTASSLNGSVLLDLAALVSDKQQHQRDRTLRTEERGDVYAISSDRLDGAADRRIIRCWQNHGGEAASATLRCFLSSALEVVIENHVDTAAPIVIEGDGVLPSLYARSHWTGASSIPG
jgi:hypothetical protein